jgi:hypothetical protein
MTPSLGRPFLLLPVLAGTLLGLALPVGSPAQTLLRKHALSGGAVDVTGGAFRLRATVGEVGVVGHVGSASGDLRAGFWPGYHVVAHVVDAPEGEVPSSGAAIRYANFLHPGTPNPFRGATTLRYSVSRPSTVRLDVFDVTGRRVTTLTDCPQQAGSYGVVWDGRDRFGAHAGSGVYFTRLRIGGWSSTKKIQKLD